MYYLPTWVLQGAWVLYVTLVLHRCYINLPLVARCSREERVRDLEIFAAASLDRRRDAINLSAAN